MEFIPFDRPIQTPLVQFKRNGIQSRSTAITPFFRVKQCCGGYLVGGAHPTLHEQGPEIALDHVFPDEVVLESFPSG